MCTAMIKNSREQHHVTEDTKAELDTLKLDY